MKHEDKTLLIQKIRYSEHKEALKKIESLLKKQPNDGKVLVEKGTILLELDKEKEALKIFDKLLKIDSTAVYGWYGYGYYYNDDDKYDKAIESLDKALQLEPGYSDALAQKSHSLYMKDKFKESSTNCELSLKLDPQNESALLTRSVLCLEFNEYEKSLECSNKIIKNNPNDPSAWHFKARALYELKKLKDACHAHEKGLEIDPSFIEPWKDLGLIYLELEEFSKAINAFKQEIKFSGNGVSWKYIAEAHEEQQDFQKALECYDKGLKSEPNSIELLEDKAALLTKLDKDEKALKIYDKIQRLLEKENEDGFTMTDIPSEQEIMNSNDEVNFYYNKALSLKKLEQYVEAYQTIEDGFRLTNSFNLDLLELKLDIFKINGNYLEGLALVKKFQKVYGQFDKKSSSMARLYNQEARFLGSLGRYRDSKDVFDIGLKIDPNNGDLLSGKAISLKYLDDISGCLKILEKMQKMEPNDFQYNHAKGILFAYKDMFNDALKCFYKSEKIKPDNEYILLNIAEILLVLKKFKTSLNYLEKLLKINPKNSLYLAQKGFALLSLGNSKEAQKLIEKSITMQSSTIPREIAFIWFTRSCVLLNTEKIEEAIGDLKLAFSLDREVLEWLKIFGYAEKLNQIKSWNTFLKLVGVNHNV